MKIYITKWALTKGILEAEAEILPSGTASVDGLWEYIPPHHYQLGLQQARERVEEMRQRAIRSARRKLDRLESLNPATMEPRPTEDLK